MLVAKAVSKLQGCSSAGLQEFLGVYQILKQQLLDDPLIQEQPDFARTWLAKVRTNDGCAAALL